MFPPLFTLNRLSRQLLPRLPAGILSLFHAATPRILILSNCTMIWWPVQETKHVKWNILRTLLPICFGSRCVLVPQFCSAAISHKVFQIFGIVSLQDISSMLSFKQTNFSLYPWFSTQMEIEKHMPDLTPQTEYINIRIRSVPHIINSENCWKKTYHKIRLNTSARMILSQIGSGITSGQVRLLHIF